MNDINTKQIERNGTGSILVILGLIAIMVMFTESMLIPALPTLQAEFNSTATWTAWILLIYLVVGTVSTPIFGSLGDSYGKKKTLLICMGLYTFGVIATVLRGTCRVFCALGHSRALDSPCSRLHMPSFVMSSRQKRWRWPPAS
jgi:MFS family permease